MCPKDLSCTYHFNPSFVSEEGFGYYSLSHSHARTDEQRSEYAKHHMRSICLTQGTADIEKSCDKFRNDPDGSAPISACDRDPEYRTNNQCGQLKSLVSLIGNLERLSYLHCGYIAGLCDCRIIYDRPLVKCRNW
jgi:hypothetical protein